VKNDVEEVRVFFNSKLILKADKEWVRKIFNKVRDLLTNIEKKERDRDEAILSRKPLEQTNCASCDTQMKEMRGLTADHLNWNNFPRAESHLRMSNLGKGYSRMLHLMKKQEGDSDDESNAKKKITFTDRHIVSSISDRKVKVISERPNTSKLPHIVDEK